MPKITVNKQVFWSSAGRDLSGKVRQVVGDHLVVSSSGSNYILHSSSVRLKPMDKLASLRKSASIQDNPRAPKGIKIRIDYKTRQHNMKWLDAEGTAGCSASEEPIIDAVDRIWEKYAVEKDRRWNTEITQQKPIEPEQEVQLPPQQQEQKKKPQQQLPPEELTV